MKKGVEKKQSTFAKIWETGDKYVDKKSNKYINV